MQKRKNILLVIILMLLLAINIALVVRALSVHAEPQKDESHCSDTNPLSRCGPKEKQAVDQPTPEPVLSTPTPVFVPPESEGK